MRRKRNRHKRKVSKLKRVKNWLLLSLLLNLFLFGAFLNFIAIKNNGGKMPVQTNETIYSDKHFAFQNKSEVQFYYLTDFIYIKGWAWISIGDVFIVSACALYLIIYAYKTSITIYKLRATWKRRHRHRKIYKHSIFI